MIWMTQIVDVFRTSVWRSVAAKADGLETTFMQHVVGQVVPNAKCVLDWGYLVG